MIGTRILGFSPGYETMTIDVTDPFLGPEQRQDVMLALGQES
jgi:hypothetical protein